MPTVLFDRNGNNQLNSMGLTSGGASLFKTSNINNNNLLPNRLGFKYRR
jgi:hypothetical protein